MAGLARTQADFYKTGHIFQYPAGTELVYSNFTPRSARLAPVIPELFDNKIVWFGLQGFIKSFLMDTWERNFSAAPRKRSGGLPTPPDAALGAGAVLVAHIAALWELGYLPIEIRAPARGVTVDIGVPPHGGQHPAGLLLADQLHRDRAFQRIVEARHHGHHRLRVPQAAAGLCPPDRCP
ncbi:MAG: DUF5598 domain-containing protein [Betaproteobacteria bacterium]|nr:DUF5598 domain-containing protein [Betaproteobacteria bacterium]